MYQLLSPAVFCVFQQLMSIFFMGGTNVGLVCDRAGKIFRRAYEFKEDETIVMDFACGVGGSAYIS